MNRDTCSRCNSGHSLYFTGGYTKYTTDQLNADIRQINEQELEPIRIDRGKRYGDSEDGGDTLANVATLDWIGGASGVIECSRRIERQAKRLIRNGTPPDKADLENACHDLINYAYYTLILYRRQHAAQDTGR